jgi:predicted GH43/DUF377 family glycosyl hydrolase
VSPQSIVHENGRYRLWYHSYDGTRRRIGYAESPDGLTWTKRSEPVLDVGTPGAWDDGSIVEPRVFHMSDGYRMYYGGMHRGASAYRLGIATSPDGITWTRSADSPVFGDYAGGPYLDAGAGIITDAQGTWHMWYGVAPFQAIHYASSPDGISWTPGPDPVLTPNPDPSSADHQGVGDSVSVYRDDGEYRVMYTGLNLSYPQPPGRIEAICIATIADPNA